MHPAIAIANRSARLTRAMLGGSNWIEWLPLPTKSCMRDHSYAEYRLSPLAVAESEVTCYF